MNADQTLKLKVLEEQFFTRFLPFLTANNYQRRDFEGRKLPAGFFSHLWSENKRCVGLYLYEAAVRTVQELERVEGKGALADVLPLIRFGLINHFEKGYANVLAEELSALPEQPRNRGLCLQGAMRTIVDFKALTEYLADRDLTGKLEDVPSYQGDTLHTGFENASLHYAFVSDERIEFALSQWDGDQGRECVCSGAVTFPDPPGCAAEVEITLKTRGAGVKLSSTDWAHLIDFLTDLPRPE